MKNIIVLILHLGFTLSVYSQSVDLDKVLTNDTVTSLSFSVPDRIFVKNAVYENNNIRVELETNQFANTAYANSITWKRYTSGGTLSGSLPVPVTTASDFVIGDGGNKILFAFFRLGIEYRVYEFQAGQYSLLDSGVVAPVVYNPPISVMQYAGVALDIDQNDNVVLLYSSFNAGLYNSDVMDFFAQAGDINGNWKSYPNSFNAFLITQGLALPNQFEASRGDVAITKYAQNNMVNFTFPVGLPNGSNYLYLAQVSFNDLVSNTVSGLSHHTIASSSSEYYIFPSIDAPNIAFEPVLQDNWVLTYDAVHGKNDIKVVKGKNGSFISTPYLSSLLQLNKQLGLPVVRYQGNGFGVAFSSNDTLDCKDRWDPFFITLTDSLTLLDSSLVRLNTDGNLTGDQASLYYSMPMDLSADPYISFFDQQSQKIFSVNLNTQIPCANGLSLESDGSFITQPHLLKKEIYNLNGRLLTVLKPDEYFRDGYTGIVIVVKYYSDGSIDTEKVGYVK